MALPDVTVEIAFDSGFATLEGARTWTDVSAYVEGTEDISISYGRADELSTADPNAMSVTFDNRDGRFTPGKASSPYYPNVKKGKPIRVTVTYSAVDYIRFTGYINEWPLVWPDGSSAASTVTVTASSRRARLGQTAPLTSAIRAAYLETDPQAYWPMTEDVGTTARGGQQAFRDVTDVGVSDRDAQVIGSWNTTASAPVVRDGTPGPTDEESLVRLDSYDNDTLDQTFPHYVGAGNVISVFTAGAVTAEVVCRIRESATDLTTWSRLIHLLSRDGTQRLWVTALSNLGVSREVAAVQALYDESGALIGARVTDEVEGYNPDVYEAAVDGEIHHYAVTLEPNGANTDMKAYFDGAQIGTTITITNAIPLRFTDIALGDSNSDATLWVGHAAVHDRALSAAEILAHAQAATAASETDAERVVRVAGRVGVPAAEVDVEASVALPLGPQPEAGRSAAEVIDELAMSTGGILYDTRSGHLALQARNHRYNQTAAFTLNATTQEIEGDLTAVLDDRYLVNTVETTREGVEDATPIVVTDDTSIDDYGVYTRALQIVTSSDQEAEAAGQDLLYRFAQPTVRVSQVSVNLTNLTTSQRAEVLEADIGTLFNISSLPAQAPTDPMPLYMEGYTETVSATRHDISINTTPGNLYTNVAVLDDASHNILGSGITLAY